MVERSEKESKKWRSSRAHTCTRRHIFVSPVPYTGQGARHPPYSPPIRAGEAYNGEQGGVKEKRRRKYMPCPAVSKKILSIIVRCSTARQWLKKSYQDVKTRNAVRTGYPMHLSRTGLNTFAKDHRVNVWCAAQCTKQPSLRLPFRSGPSESKTGRPGLSEMPVGSIRAPNHKQSGKQP